MNVETINTNFKFIDCNFIAFLNGQSGLHETEEKLFKQLAAANYTNIVMLDNLFERANKLHVLNLLNVDTIVVGTTGTYNDKFKELMSFFKQIKFLPKTALITMGEDYFFEYSKSVDILTLMPITYSNSDIVIWKK